MLALMSGKGGFREGIEAGRRAAQQPVAVRRRRKGDGGDAGTPRARRERPPLAAFGVMAVSIVLILGSSGIQHALGMTGNLVEIAGIFLSAVSVMMLRSARGK
jgi:hypothetical protein